jgi:hypothetical protein
VNSSKMKLNSEKQPQRPLRNWEKV